MQRTEEELQTDLELEQLDHQIALESYLSEDLLNAAATLEAIQTEEQQYSMEEIQLVEYAILGEAVSLEKKDLGQRTIRAGDILADIWEKVRDAISRIVRSLREFFKKLFRTLPRLRKRLEQSFKELKENNEKAVETSDSKELGFPQEVKVARSGVEIEDYNVVYVKKIANSNGEVDFPSAAEAVRDFRRDYVGAFVNNIWQYYSVLTDTFSPLAVRQAADEFSEDDLTTKTFTPLNNLKEAFKKTDSIDKNISKAMPGQKIFVPIKAEFPRRISSFKDSPKDISSWREVMVEQVVGFTIQNDDDAKEPNDTLKKLAVQDLLDAEEPVMETMKFLEEAGKERDDILETREAFMKKLKEPKVARSNVPGAAELDKLNESNNAGKLVVMNIATRIMLSMGGRNLVSAIQRYDKHAYDFLKAMASNVESVNKKLAA
jgi:hypothetical protein